MKMSAMRTASLAAGEPLISDIQEGTLRTARRLGLPLHRGNGPDDGCALTQMIAKAYAFPTINLTEAALADRTTCPCT
jgi:hypothetical protein